MEEKFLTYKEVAAMFKVSRQAVGNWVRSRRLPVVHITPGTVRFRASDIETFVRASTGRPAKKEGTTNG